MNKGKIIKRILFWTVAVFIVIISSGVFFTIAYKDDIINYFVGETNKYITTPVDVGKIDVSVFSHFPDVSVNLQNVVVKEGTEDHLGTLGTAKSVSVSFNLLDILHKNYTINGLYFTDAEVNLKIDKEGNTNYLFIKRDSAKKAGSVFSLKNIKIENVKIDYEDLRSDYHVALIVQNAKSELNQQGKILDISVKGDLVSDEVRVAQRKFFNNKTVSVDTKFEYDLTGKVYSFTSGLLNIDKGEFSVEGTVDAAEKIIDLNIKGINTSFQTVNSLLSSDISKYFNEYRSKGNAYFSGKVSGKYGENSRPAATFDFGATNASFFHPKYNRQITDVNLTGHFTTGKKNMGSNYRLDLKEFSCRLEDKLLEGSLILENFDDYNIDLLLKGEADVNNLLLIYPKDIVKTAFGSIKMDIHINGKLKNAKLTQNINANGDIDLKQISFVLTGERLPFNKINGSMSLRNNDLAVSDFTGYVGKSDFKINGFVKDISKIMTSEKKSYKLQADFQSNRLDFDELLKSNFASRDTASSKSSKYEFTISPQISLDLNCEIDQLNFKRFHGRSINGHVDINNQTAVLKNVAVRTMGGRINFNGAVNSSFEDLIQVRTNANLYDINIDSIFYVFKNFNQSWLIDRNLKGQLDADVNLSMSFNKNLMLNSKSISATIKTAVSNGELNDFEPIMKLSKFVEEESLANMRFSRMTNDIRIENRVIYLPEMEIRSNVSNILVSGTHSFDKDIDYHLSVPMKSFIRISKKKNYDQSARSGMNLLLKITGTTSDYTIAYDTKALKDKIIGSFSDEGEEWRNIKNKEKTPDQFVPEPEEDDYFDFEDEDRDN